MLIQNCLPIPTCKNTPRGGRMTAATIRQKSTYEPPFIISAVNSSTAASPALLGLTPCCEDGEKMVRHPGPRFMFAPRKDIPSLYYVHYFRKLHTMPLSRNKIS
jgi:hypothetical protein